MFRDFEHGGMLKLGVLDLLEFNRRPDMPIKY